MQLITILLATVSILTFLSGVIVFFGSTKGDKIRSLWYFLAAIFATAWMSSILLFLLAKPEWGDVIDWHVKWTFVSAVLIDTAFLGYIVWKEKYGRYITVLFSVLAIIISGLIFVRPEWLYSSVVLHHTGNSVVMNTGPLYFAYIGFFAIIVPVVVLSLLKQYAKTRSNRKRGGDLVIMISFGLSSGITLIANLLLPLFGNWSIIWLGPLALSATIISLYYTILRYRSLNLASIWLRIFSYIVVVASVAIIYMIIFTIIFAALFRGSTPSTEVIVLNFIMISIFLLLMPAISELSTIIRSLISGDNTTTKKEHN